MAEEQFEPTKTVDDVIGRLLIKISAILPMHACIGSMAD